MHTFCRDKRRVTFREFFIYLASAFFLIFGTLIYICPNVSILDLSYEFSDLESTKEGLLKKNRLLKVEVATLKSLEKIEHIASAQGFYAPQKEQIVYIISR